MHAIRGHGGLLLSTSIQLCNHLENINIQGEKKTKNKNYDLRVTALCV